MQPVSLAAAAHPPSEAVPKKLLHAAQEFEALLLHDLLGPVEKSFSSIPGKDSDAGSGNFQYLGTQALASNLASSGGFGIAAMIVHNMMTHNQIAPQSATHPGIKVLSGKGR